MTRGTTRKKPPWLRLLTAAALSEGLYVVMTMLGGPHPECSSRLEGILPYFVLWAGLFLVYATAARSLRDTNSRKVWSFIFLTSLLFRATLIPFSDPSRFIPMPSPLQWLHHAIQAPEIALKILSVSADMAALALGPGLLKAAGLPLSLCLLYGWNPLVITEVAKGNRLEPFSLLLLVIAIRALQRGSQPKAALAYGLGLLSGLWMATGLPLLVRKLGGYGLLVLAMVTAAWGASVLTLSPDLSFLHGPNVGGSLLPALTSLMSLLVTRQPLVALSLCLGTWILLIVYRGFARSPEPNKLPLEMLLAYGSFLMVSPRVLPWAFLPVAYFAAFSLNRGWLVFTATAPVTYLAWRNGQWADSSFWSGFAQYFPAYFALVFGWLGGSSHKHLSKN